MTQEDRELLLKDLCARLPYKTWVQYEGKEWLATGYGHGRVSLLSSLFSSAGGPCPLVEEVKPYLRPMSSMTEDERQEARDKFFAGSDHYDIDDIGEILADTYQPYESVYTLSFPRLTGYIDWLFAHHFDIHDLIKKGLAIEAPEGMYA